MTAGLEGPAGERHSRGPSRPSRRAPDGGYVPLADLGLRLQCGFASAAGGNQLTVDDERRKLELVAATASKIWG
jgi:hypothetical protein